METNNYKNSNNNDGGDKQQQLRGSAQNRTNINKLANDEDKPAAAAGEDQNCSNNKNMEEGNNLDLELENLSREELIKMVRKQMATKIEVQKKFETASEQEMKIQLSLETWYDMLAFVPRYQLGKIVPKIGDRKFASIVQKFLHEYGEITIDRIQIVAPYEEDPSGPHPRVRAWQNNFWLRFEMAEAQMPTNIKNFVIFELSYFDQAVLKFMQKFQQNGLLDNVSLEFESKALIQPVLGHLLPLIKSIFSIDVRDSAQLVDIYDAGNSKEIYELNMKMMEKTRFLNISYDPENLRTDKIELYCRWLYQTARADGKKRVLDLVRMDVNYAPISLFIERLKQDFLMATYPVTFSIQINLPKAFKPLEDICLDNDKTKERFLTKMKDEIWELVLHISRYLQASIKKRHVENEKEVLAWIGSIYLTEELQIVHT